MYLVCVSVGSGAKGLRQVRGGGRSGVGRGVGTARQQLRYELSNEVCRRERGFVASLAEVEGEQSASQCPLLATLRPRARPHELAAQRGLARARAAHHDRAARLVAPRALLQRVCQLGERPLAAEEALAVAGLHV